MSTLVTYKDITISLSGKPVLDIQTFAVPAHQCTLITGRNGSGKTTLLKIMSGLLKPNTATIEYQGLTMNWKQAKPYIQKDIIYLHQQPYLFDASVADNIAYGLHRAGESKATAHTKVMQALDWADLSHLAHRSAKQLSGGEKQRVALTRARILSPRLLLLDEPTASMDIDSKRQTSELLQRLKTEGVSIMISSHETHTIEHIADQHVHLENGQLTPLVLKSDSNKVTILSTSRNAK
ncbi:MAG: energy-coupling factor ABC transporter ATP-binding protein [Piscirickettsiaceae bacterium]|nr:MAG: energy-coupling factor ABC transporter ATP-binding protein [Piscirickettsiaceae bacterium]PCI70560.1 MAG: energy-coupling factor ABC transporter ATP-binding protein [Piscirickettsiaceae bacterium]